jgi:hypothetical protein
VSKVSRRNLAIATNLGIPLAEECRRLKEELERKIGEGLREQR